MAAPIVDRGHCVMGLMVFGRLSVFPICSGSALLHWSCLCVGRAGSYSMAPIYCFCTESCELTPCLHYSMTCLSFSLGVVCLGRQTLFLKTLFVACLSHSYPPPLILFLLGWAGGHCASATVILVILVTRIWLSCQGLPVGHHSHSLSKLFQRCQTWDSPNFLASLASFLESTIPKPMLLGSRT